LRNLSRARRQSGCPLAGTGAFWERASEFDGGRPLDAQATGKEPSEFSAGYRADNGQDQPMFVLPKDLTLALVSGYDAVVRKKIIDR
jgi:hypothetical protein